MFDLDASTSNQIASDWQKAFLFRITIINIKAFHWPKCNNMAFTQWVNLSPNCLEQLRCLKALSAVMTNNVHNNFSIQICMRKWINFIHIFGLVRVSAHCRRLIFWFYSARNRKTHFKCIHLPTLRWSTKWYITCH